MALREPRCGGSFGAEGASVRRELRRGVVLCDRLWARPRFVRLGFFAEQVPCFLFLSLYSINPSRLREGLIFLFFSSVSGIVEPFVFSVDLPLDKYPRRVYNYGEKSNDHTAFKTEKRRNNYEGRAFISW